jgi:hypothetical protein
MPEPFSEGALENLDRAALEERLASVRTSMAAKPQDAQLEAAVRAALHADIRRIREYAAARPDEPFAQANRHLLRIGENAVTPLAMAATSSIEEWHGVGSVSLSGIVMWALGVTVNFAPPYGFLFGATGGPDLALDVFTSGIVGSFVVDPAVIRAQEMRPEETVLGTVYKGSCRFQLGQLGAGAGAVRISFYSLKGTYWGMLGGVAAGLGGVSLSGQGDMVWS